MWFLNLTGKPACCGITLPFSSVWFLKDLPSPVDSTKWSLLVDFSWVSTLDWMLVLLQCTSRKFLLNIFEAQLEQFTNLLSLFPSLSVKFWDWDHSLELSQCGRGFCLVPSSQPFSKFAHFHFAQNHQSLHFWTRERKLRPNEVCSMHHWPWKIFKSVWILYEI